MTSGTTQWIMQNVASGIVLVNTHLTFAIDILDYVNIYDLITYFVVNMA